jgi:hypothetical protein
MHQCLLKQKFFAGKSFRMEEKKEEGAADQSPK